MLDSSKDKSYVAHCNTVSVIFIVFETSEILPVQWSLHFKTTCLARKYPFKLEVVLKWRDIYIEYTVMARLKMEEIVK